MSADSPADGRYLPVPTSEDGSRARRMEPVRRLAALLPAFLKLAYRLGRDRRVPLRRRVFALGALAYVVSPVDLMPDAVPGLGQADDVLVLALALRMLMDAAGPDIVAEHWDGPPDALETVDAVVEWGADLVPRSVRRAVRRVFT